MRAAAPAGYAELQVTTNYSFLRGASHPEELFAAAAVLGLPALGVADRHSVAGIVRCWEAARVTGVRLVAGCRVDIEDGTAVLLDPMDRSAWSRLCRLLTLGKGRAGKGGCRLSWEDLVTYGEGLLALLVPDEADEILARGLTGFAPISATVPISRSRSGGGPATTSGSGACPIWRAPHGSRPWRRATCSTTPPSVGCCKTC